MLFTYVRNINGARFTRADLLPTRALASVTSIRGHQISFVISDSFFNQTNWIARGARNAFAVGAVHVNTSFGTTPEFAAFDTSF